MRSWAIAVVLVLAFVAGAIVDQRFNTKTPFFEDGQPLAIIRAGDLLDDNKIGFGVKISGNVRAGSDLALVLLNGGTIARPLALIPEPCGRPDPLSPNPENRFVPCAAIMEASGGGGEVNGVTIYGGQIGMRVE